MRFKIKFILSGKKQIMPLNNQYPISSWIYKVIGKADKEFAKILHENGYRTAGGKQFKLFTFSKLQFPKKTWKILPKSDRMNIWARSAYLTVSFQLPEQSEKFVMGLFKEQQTFIGDKISEIEMKVEGIEVLENVDFGGMGYRRIRFKSLTGIVFGLQIEGKKYEQYISPLHPEYKRVFLNSLIDKYEATGKNDVKVEDLDFIIKEISPKTVMQTIKAGTDAETKVRGFNYEFELGAPKEIAEVGFNSGFGNMCSLGFGFCEMIENDRNIIIHG